MKILVIAILFASGCHLAISQNVNWRADDSLPIPELVFDASGKLIIRASPTSSPNDFDFLKGAWNLSHRKLKARLSGSNEWEEFETVVEDFGILAGNGNMDVGRAVIGGKQWEGRTMRLFNPKTRLWSLYWMTNQTSTLGTPVVGSFENGVGHFFGQEDFNGKPVIVLFRWDVRTKDHPIWSQAFSPDNGKTWEWNWFNVSTRIADTPLKDMAKKNFSIPIPPLQFDSKGELVITSSGSSSAHDFDFLIGKWTLKHRKLTDRLVNSSVWEEFESTVEDFSILEGTGNMDVAYDTIAGSAWEGRTTRLFDSKTGLWRLYWVASNVGIMDPPVVGSFKDGIGHFFTRDVYQGRSIIMMFRWDKRDKDRPVWSQAFSPDNGKTWEWNWMNLSVRSR